LYPNITDMDAGAHKLLETVVLKTLHAHSFTRSSSQASLALTDLLSRYLVLLATTCSQYAQHAGRLNITVRDAMCALDELGVSMDELHEYCGTEGDELARYSGHCAKRQEDLSEFKGQSERDDCILCIDASLPLVLSVTGMRATRRA
jgi:histone H3/H4